MSLGIKLPPPLPGIGMAQSCIGKSLRERNAPPDGSTFAPAMGLILGFPYILSSPEQVVDDYGNSSLIDSARRLGRRHAMTLPPDITDSQAVDFLDLNAAVPFLFQSCEPPP